MTWKHALWVMGIAAATYWVGVRVSFIRNNVMKVPTT